MKRLLFIHRSVGHNLIADGRLYEYIHTHLPELEFNDYDHNFKILTTADGQQQKLNLAFPGGNTNPDHYAAFFCERGQADNPELAKLVSDYDVVTIKSCYPNSHITSDDQLQAIQNSYLTIVRFFSKRPEKQLIILTSPPLRPSRTKKAAAARARRLANWLSGNNFAPNVHVFDFFDLLATPEGHLGANRLRRDYRRWLPVDSHPNASASRAIAPRFVTFITKRIFAQPSD